MIFNVITMNIINVITMNINGISDVNKFKRPQYNETSSKTGSNVQ